MHSGEQLWQQELRLALWAGYAVFGRGQGDSGESPVIRFLDWDKNTVAEAAFEKIG